MDVEENVDLVQPGPSSASNEADQEFDRNICFICGKHVDNRKHTFGGSAVKVKMVSRPSLKDSLMDTLLRCQNAQSLQILSRIKDVDLVGKQARYHFACISNFRRKDTLSGKKGRSTSPVDDAMLYIYRYIENSQYCQFTMSHLLEQIPEEDRPHEITVKRRLQEKYGNEILIFNVRGTGAVVCFKDIGHQLLSEAWYSNKHKDPIEEKKRVVREAGAIVREAIRSTFYSTDQYPASTEFLEGVEKDVPDCLSIFLEEVILPGKRKTSFPYWKKQVTAIGHAIIKATRPRCFLSKILLGVGCFLKKKFSSRFLVDTLAAIGFSCSYSEVELLELSYISRQQPGILPGGFSQWVADNADFNVNTLDGRNSWHVMALIQCVTPATAIETEEPASRKFQERRSINVAELGNVELVPYDIPPSVGLNTIKVANLDELYPISKPILPSYIDLLWVYGKWTCDSSVPGWNGFMEQITETLPFDTSKILYLPFINAPPTDNSTVLTTLLHACEVGNASKQETKFVTFDQQLYWKARDIVATAPENSELKNVVVRLGGFHLVMSFMGAIGNIMSGSGLENVWGVIYAEGSIPQMMLGKAYARAVRAHFLTNLALAKIVMEYLDEDEPTFRETRDFADEILSDLDRTNIMDPCHKESFDKFSTLFEKKLIELEGRGPTAKLWIQYYKMTCLLKQFLESERTGDWTLHLKTVRQMLPFFHASAHFNYAKSAHLYLQDCASLKSRMTPAEYHKFTDLGYCTIRRSSKYFAGISPDQTIEQTVMRLAKSREGVTVPGRGITDNATAKWALGMFSLINVCEQFETFCNVYSQTSEQHVDMRIARRKRDNEDVEKLDGWFASHCPFPEISDIVSIGNGVVGDETITCHQAEEKGNEMMAAIINDTFGFLKFERKKAVKPLSTMTAKLTVKDIVVPIDPMLLFQRIAISQPTTEDLQQYLTYELSPYPMSLFDENGFRKGKKSALYDSFTPLETVAFGPHRFYVVDGGYFMHKVKWQKRMSVQDICRQYVAYLQRHYSDGKVAVVFDGYSPDIDSGGTKSAERQRRSTRYVSPSIEFDQSTLITVTQEIFLSNHINKDRFIDVLRPALEDVGIEVRQAYEDADRLIIETALEKSPHHDSTIIIGEDVDLLVLLTALGNADSKIYLKKPGHGRNPERIYSWHSFKYEALKPYLLLLHAFTGCDTTSAPYFQGKQKLIDLMNSSQSLQTVAKNFTDPFCPWKIVETNGELIFVALYGGINSRDSLATIRFKKFAQCSTKTKVNLCSLPPSPDAAKFHSYRVYFQVQAWLGHNMDPTEWGWKKTSRGLEPITTELDPAPDKLMKLITCGCKTGNCGAACGCRKAGLTCSVACKYCGGENCSNIPSVDLENDVLEDIDLNYPSQVVHYTSMSNKERNEESDSSDAGSSSSSSRASSDVESRSKKRLRQQ